jgi:hypothetical protein
MVDGSGHQLGCPRIIGGRYGQQSDGLPDMGRKNVPKSNDFAQISVGQGQLETIRLERICSAGVVARIATG